MLWFFLTVMFIFGSLVGSFLNCVIYRLEENKSFLKGRSFCPYCKHILGWQDLLPVLSFLLLKGRCRYCQKPISWQYPLVEIATGLLLIVNFYFLIFNQFLIFNFQNLLLVTYYILITAFLIIIFVYDLRHYIIPDKVVYPAIIMAIFFNLFQDFNNLTIEQFNNLTIVKGTAAGLLAAGFFFALWLLSHGRWMGFGDVKLAFLMGIFLGPYLILLALFTAFLSGAIIGLILIALKKKGLKSEVPFGPFLVAGTFFALFWGQRILDWYINFLTI